MRACVRACRQRCLLNSCQATPIGEYRNLRTVHVRGPPLRNSHVWQERARVYEQPRLDHKSYTGASRGSADTHTHTHTHKYTRREEETETALRPRERRRIHKGNSYESMINRPCLPLVFTDLSSPLFSFNRRDSRRCFHPRRMESDHPARLEPICRN